MAVIIELVAAEAAAAQAKYGPINSSQEALGVLLEEFQELIEAIRGHSLEAVRLEAVQIAAVALRLAEHCLQAPTPFTERSQLW